jgi:hypothetical protein
MKIMGSPLGYVIFALATAGLTSTLWSAKTLPPLIDMYKSNQVIVGEATSVNCMDHSSVSFEYILDGREFHSSENMVENCSDFRVGSKMRVWISRRNHALSSLRNPSALIGSVSQEISLGSLVLGAFASASLYIGLSRLRKQRR